MHTLQPLISLRLPDSPPNFSASPKAAVLASGRGSNFQAILNAIHAHQLHINLQGLIYNNPDAGCKIIAESEGIQNVYIDHKHYKKRVDFDKAIVQQLQEWEVELVLMAGWMRLITPTFINAFPDRILNLHPSILPAFKGLHAIEQTFEAGCALAGCTVHLVTPELDNGPIIGQAALPILANDTLDTLTKRIHKAEHLLYPKAIQFLISSKP